MKKILALMAALALPACTDPYGNPDPGATALLGAGVGAAVGLGVAAAASDNRADYRPYGGYYQAPPPRRYYSRRYGPRPYYHRPPPGYYRGPPPW